MSLCCNENVAITGIYKPVNVRLLDFGNEVYKDLKSSQRVMMWIFSFYDEENECPVCQEGIEKMYLWFSKYGLMDDPVRGVRIVIENHAKDNMIYRDFGREGLPMNIFADSDGKIFDILHEFPDETWLERYIQPIIKKDGSLL